MQCQFKPSDIYLCPPPERVPGFFHFRNFTFTFDPPVQFKITAHVIFGDRIVDDVINRATGEGKNAVQHGLNIYRFVANHIIGRQTRHATK